MEKEKFTPLTEEDVKSLLSEEFKQVDQVTMKKFLALCNSKNLNPFLNEAYLLSYRERDGGAVHYSIVVSKDVFLKRAVASPVCDGFQSGVVVLNKENKEVVERDGCLVLPFEELVGGWALVKRKNFSIPYKRTVSLSEYIKPTRSWRSMPATMIAKVALVQALRDFFPHEFAGMYTEEELKEAEDAAVKFEKENTPRNQTSQEKQESSKKSQMNQERKKALDYLLYLTNGGFLKREDVMNVLNEKFKVPHFKDLPDAELDNFLNEIKKLVTKLAEEKLASSENSNKNHKIETKETKKVSSERARTLEYLIYLMNSGTFSEKEIESLLKEKFKVENFEALPDGELASFIDALQQLVFEKETSMIEKEKINEEE